MSAPTLPLKPLPPTLTLEISKHSETVLTRSRSSSISANSAVSRKFPHFYYPTVLERPDAIDEITTALETKNARKLADLTVKNGLPPSLRPDAWPLLLRNHPSVLKARARFASTPRSPVSQLPLKRIRSDIQNLKRLGNIGDADEEAIYDAVVEFLQQTGTSISYDPAMVRIAEFLINGEHCSNKMRPSWQSPVSSTSSSPHGTHKFSAQDIISFPNLLHSSSSSISSNDSEISLSSFTGVSPNALNETFSNVVLLINENPTRFSEFVTLLRSFLPELGTHFALESVLGATGGDDWLVWWLKWLGIRVFPPSTIARFWDLYFSMYDVDSSALMKQHLYNCLVLMRGSQSRLLELDQSECRQFLSNVPICKDLEALLIEASSLARCASD